MSQLKVNSIVPVGGLPSGANGGIIQVVQTVISGVQSYTADAYAFTDMPNFSATITPSSNSSKVLIVVGIGGIHQDAGSIIGKVLRGSTDVGIGDADGNRPRCGFRMYGSNIYNGNHTGSYQFNFLDSPATTSATTYKLQTAGESGTSYPVYLNRTINDSNNNYNYRGRPISTMTLYEVTA
jgi:hypothetical protein|tara:strand:+ start:832 stop:1374 length:543 start_codon:yes stop_codon:yes gene_type:complete